MYAGTIAEEQRAAPAVRAGMERLGLSVADQCAGLWRWRGRLVDADVWVGGDGGAGGRASGGGGGGSSNPAGGGGSGGSGAALIITYRFAP